MLNAQVVDQCFLYPHKCLCGGSTKGPFIDTGVELSVLGGDHRIYLCSRICVKRAAQLAKLVGKDFDQVAIQAARADELEARLAQKAAELGAAEGIVQNRNLKIQEDTDEIIRLRGRVKQLEGIVGEQARAHLSLVGGDEPQSAA